MNKLAYTRGAVKSACSTYQDQGPTETQFPTAFYTRSNPIKAPIETRRGLPAPDILQLVHIGLSLIPIERGGKRPPDGFKWRQYQERAASREQVEQWQQDFPGCNWAAVWGSVSGGVIAVDIDSAAAFAWCQRQGGFNERWPVWYETGRGWQYLFRLPQELANVRGINPHRGVEVRSNGQYSVLPPSIHPSGKRYTWKRFGRIPYAPQWILDYLTGVATQESTTSVTPQQWPVHNATRHAQRTHRRRTHDIDGRNPRLLKSAGYQWLWSHAFGPHHHHHPFFSLAVLLRAAGLDQNEAARKLDQWRYKCTRPVYNEREAAAIVKTVYRISYGISIEGLRRAIDVNGERMPESNALDLKRLFPNPQQRKRGQRIHDPLFVSVGKILEILYTQRVMKPIVITHKEMAKLTKLSEDRIKKAAPFLDKIGVRTTRRQESSTVSVYTLRGLNTPTSQLIKRFALWRGYSMPWKVVASFLWRRVRALMRAVLSHLNTVFVWLSATWHGETDRTAIGFESVAFEGVSGRAPPN